MQLLLFLMYFCFMRYEHQIIWREQHGVRFAAWENERRNLYVIYKNVYTYTQIWHHVFEFIFM